MRSCECGCQQPIPEYMRCDARYLRGHRQRAHRDRTLTPERAFWEAARRVRRKRPTVRDAP